MELARMCPQCGKICHATRDAARRYARRVPHGARLRVARCPAGQGWHLTPERPARRRRTGRRRPRDTRPVVRRLVAGGRRAQ